MPPPPPPDHAGWGPGLGMIPRAGTGSGPGSPSFAKPAAQAARDHSMTTLELEIKDFAHLLAKVMRRDTSFIKDIRSLEDSQLSNLRAMIERMHHARKATIAVIDSEMSVRALTETMLRDHPHFACPLSHLVMRDPVVAADGHSYERRAIESHYASGSRISPVEGTEMRAPTLIPNRNLKAEIEKVMTALHADSNVRTATETVTTTRTLVSTHNETMPEIRTFVQTSRESVTGNTTVYETARTEAITADTAAQTACAAFPNVHFPSPAPSPGPTME